MSDHTTKFYQDMRERAAKSDDPNRPTLVQIDAMEARAGKFVTHGYVDQLLPGLMASIADAIHPLLKTQSDRIKALEALLKDNPPFEYRGTWKHDEFERNSFVTHQGSLWVARRRTTSQPGTAGDDGEHHWQLAVKRGRDARGA